MNYATTTVSSSRPNTLADRVRAMASALGCKDLWARSSGPHVLLGIGPEEAFARVTPLGTGAFGLSFRSPEGSMSARRGSRWEPVLLVDDLADVVEHALIGEGAIGLRD